MIDIFKNIVTHEEVELAISEFLDNGGEIQKVTREEVIVHLQYQNAVIPTRRKGKVASSRIRPFLEKLVESEKYTLKEIIEISKEKLNLKPATVMTYISMGKNPKYNKFKKLIIVRKGKMCFKKE